MKIDGIHHVGLYVKDGEKSLAFYEKLGGKVVHSFPMGDSGKTIYLVDLGNNAVVEIIPRGNGEDETNAHWAHLALRTDDARGYYDLALKSGALPHIEPKDVNLGTMAATIAFVLGPDKEIVEFFQVN